MNDLVIRLGLPSFSATELNLAMEYVSVMDPVAKLLDVFQGEKCSWMGIGIVLPLIYRMKKVLRSRNFPNLEAIRDRMLDKVDER